MGKEHRRGIYNHTLWKSSETWSYTLLWQRLYNWISRLYFNFCFHHLALLLGQWEIRGWGVSPDLITCSFVCFFTFSTLCLSCKWELCCKNSTTPIWNLQLFLQKKENDNFCLQKTFSGPSEGACLLMESVEQPCMVGSPQNGEFEPILPQQAWVPM